MGEHLNSLIESVDCIPDNHIIGNSHAKTYILGLLNNIDRIEDSKYITSIQTFPDGSVFPKDISFIETKKFLTFSHQLNSKDHILTFCESGYGNFRGETEKYMRLFSCDWDNVIPKLSYNLIMLGVTNKDFLYGEKMIPHNYFHEQINLYLKTQYQSLTWSCPENFHKSF